MGVEISLFQVTLPQLKKIRCDPDLIDKWFFPVERVDIDYDNNRSFSLGRGFHGLHFMVCRKYEPKPDDPIKDFFVFGKHKFRFKVEIGSSCAYLLPQEVKDLVKMLNKVKRNRLLLCFNHEVMNRSEIYPGNWQPNDFDALYDLFLQIRNYYRDAELRNNAVINVIY